MAIGKKTGGRKKGTPNKENKELREMILQALDNCGGPEYLQKQAEAKPAAFLALLGKVLPMTVQGSNDDGSLNIKVSFAE
jgi:hypothetical protein